MLHLHRILLRLAHRGRGILLACRDAFDGAVDRVAGDEAAAADAWVADIRAAGGTAFAQAADVTDAGAVARMLEATVVQAGGLDLVFVNSGVSLDQIPVEHSDPAAFVQTLNVNLTGAYHCARLAKPCLRARGGGRMVMLGLGMGHGSAHGHARYSCSKAGLWLLVRILADELRADGIRVNELNPGPVQTTMTSVLQRPGSVVNNPIEWLKTPEDVVPLAMFLASHPTPGPTGQSFSLMRRTS